MLVERNGPGYKEGKSWFRNCAPAIAAICGDKKMKILSLAKSNLTIVLSALSMHCAGEAAEEALHQKHPQPGLLKSEFMFLQAPFPASHASTLVEAKNGLLAA